jgi:hypothetical protein
MSVRLVRSVRLSSVLRTTFAVTSKLTLFPAGAHFAAVWRRAAACARQLAAVLLIAGGVLCSVAAAQTAHFSGARSAAVNGAGGALGGNAAGAGKNQVQREQVTPSGNFGTVNIGSTSAAMSLTFTFDAAATLGSMSVVTQGAPNLDFADAGTGSCKAGSSYNSGDLCRVDVTFTPTRVGTRYGGAVLYDNSENVIATGYLQGTGSGPQISFPPGTESTVSSTVKMPGGLVVDGSGNVYVSDSVQNRVLKETPSGSGYIESILFTGLNTPGGLAVDGAGNIYLTDDYNDRVLKETPSAGGYIQSTVGNGMNKPNGVAVDGVGNLYVADAYNGRVVMETLSGGSYTQSVILTCGGVGYQSCPSAVAVDASGNLFITAYNMSQVLELTPSAGGYTRSSIGSGLVWPSQIAIDGSGDLYIADTLNSRIVKETLSAGGYIQSVVPSSNIDWPWALAVDGNGDVFIADTYNNRVLKEDYWDPPSLSFTTANNGPQAVTVENDGNEALSFPVPSTGYNPSISSDFTLDSSAASACPLVSAGSSTAGKLAAGGSCTLTVGVATAGAFRGSLVLTDTDLNAPAPNYATQTIALAAVVSSQTTLSESAAKVQVGQPITLTATVTVPAGSGTPTGQVTFNGAGTPAPVVTLNGSGEAIFTSSTLAIGTYSVTAVYSGDATDLGSSSQAVTFTVNGFASQTTISASATQVNTGQPLTLTATVTGAAGSATPTGQVTFAGAGSPTPVMALNGSGVATFTSSTLAAGAYSVTANYGGDATYNPSQSQPVYFSVSSGPPAKVTPVGGPTWNVQYGTALSLCAEVTDAGGDPMAGITVSFSGSGLAFVPASTVTNTSGQACTAVTPVTTGSFVATASVSGVASTATFNLTITPAPLTVKLRPAFDSRLYGQANANFTATVTGLIGSDTVTVTPSTEATPASPVGYYPVTATVSGADAANYTVTVISAEVHVRQAVLEVYPKGQGITYGQALAPLGPYVVLGFLNGDTASVISGAPVFTTAVTSSTPAGRYVIDSAVGTLTATNYAFLMRPGMVQVYKAHLTVTANNLTMSEGSAVPPLTYTIAGFVNGDTASVVSGAPVLETTATSSSPPGTYPIMVHYGTLSAANYVFTPRLSGVLTITP